MYNTFIPIATLPTAVLRTPLQIPGPASAGLCQNRQASAHGPRTSSLLLHYQLRYCGLLLRPGRPGKLLSEQTSKHPVNKGFQSIPHSYIMLTSRCGPGRPGKLLSEQTSKQLSTGCPQFVVGYPQVTAE